LAKHAFPVVEWRYRVYERPWSLFRLYNWSHAVVRLIVHVVRFSLVNYSKSRNKNLKLNQIKFWKKTKKNEIFKQDFQIEILRHQMSQNKNELNLRKKRIKILKQRSVWLGVMGTCMHDGAHGRMQPITKSQVSWASARMRGSAFLYSWVYICSWT
jgi:hypothetical protein